MFPNLRLIIGAAIATIALVIVMGSGVLSFRDPYRSIGDIPDVRRPLVQNSIVENPDLPQFRLLAHERRNDELQRLLDLPTGQVHAYAPEAPTVFTFKVTSPPDDSSPSDQPGAVAEETSPPDTQAASQASSQASSQTSSQVSDSQSDASPAAGPAATTAEAAEPPAATGPGDFAAAVPASAASERAPAPIDPAMTSGAASSEPPGNTEAASEVTGSIPASSIPAIEHPPLPLADPREAAGRLDVGGAATRPATRTIRARPRKIIRAVRIQTQPVPQAPVTLFGTQPGQPTPSQIENFNQRPWNIQ